jgi:acyl carrier protein
VNPGILGEPKGHKDQVNELNSVIIPARDAIAAIWTEVLELDSLEPNDDFYDIGGDSLSAIQILSRIQQRFGARVSEAEFFTARTVAGLCRFLEQAKARTEVAGVRLNYRGGPRDCFPTTSSQQRLWVLDQFIPNPEV